LPDIYLESHCRSQSHVTNNRGLSYFWPMPIRIGKEDKNPLNTGAGYITVTSTSSLLVTDMYP
jgi:hypothetical protein